MWSSDIWWHLRTGQLILEWSTVPHTDWFTFGASDRPWIDLHWLFQLLAALLYSVGGTDALVVLKAACLTATVAIGWSASGRGMPAAPKALCWFLAAVCLSGRTMVRPEMLTQVFLASALWLLARSEGNPRLLWGLPLLQLAWANCHGLFVLGVVAVAAYGVDRLVRERAGGRWLVEAAPADPKRGRLLAVGALTLLACLATPYFIDGALFPLVLYRKFTVDRELYSVIREFRRPLAYVLEYGWLARADLLAALQLGLATLASFLWLAREGRVSVYRLLLFIGFSLLAGQAVRNNGLFGLVACAVLCANCADAIALRSRRLSAAPWAPRAWVSLLAVLALAGFSVGFVTGRWAPGGPAGRHFGLGERDGRYAHAAARFAGREGLPSRVFASHLGVAAVYLFHNGPQRRVFMDGRLEVATPDTFRRYLAIQGAMALGDPRWEELLSRDAEGNLPAVILDLRGTRASHWMVAGVRSTEGWRQVFADATAAVFLEEALAERLGLPAVN
jgi:hypothetical protein